MIFTINQTGVNWVLGDRVDHNCIDNEVTHSRYYILGYYYFRSSYFVVVCC